MAQNKIKIKENEEVVAVGLFKRRSTVEIDHWAFLEEIEAPMWADLTLEPNMTAEDYDDAWFHTSHPFHHLSARQLRSAFAHPDVGNDFVNFKFQGVYSPKLPSSVSKSRGKDYISKNWRNNDGISESRNHPVNDLGGLDIAPCHDCKPKVKPENQCEVSDSITSVLCGESGATSVSSNSQVTADDRDTYGSLNSQSAGTNGVSTSTITTVSQKQDTKFSNVSRGAVVPTGGLLNALKSNLRRSCATRPALRVEIRDDRELKGRKSSSGKSSVGSSSIGHDGKVKRSATLMKTDHIEQGKMNINVNLKPRGHKSLTGKRTSSMSVSNSILEVKKMVAGNKQNRDKYLGVGGPEILVQPMKGRVVANKVCEAPVKKMAAGLKQKDYRNSNVRDLEKLVPTVKGRVKAQKLVEASAKTRTSYSSRIEGRGSVVASTCLQAVKSKVPVSENVTNRPRFGAPSVTGKVERAYMSGSSCSIKENKERVALSRISSGNCNIPDLRLIDQKRPTKLSENKGSVASVGSKVKAGRLDDRKLSSDARVYLR